jgi:hypothetical protein
MSIFNADEFTLASLTTLANETPPVPGQIGATLDFDEAGMTTKSLKIETDGASLSIVEPTARGSAGEVVDDDSRALRTFDAVHLQRDESIYADEVQGVRAYGSATEAMTIQQRLDAKMARHYRDFDLTDEWMKLGVISGKIISGKGKTILDIYAEFGLTPPDAIEWDLEDNTTAIRKACMDLVHEMEDDLVAPSYGSVVAFCGNDWFKWLTDHKEVRETYLNTAAAAELRGLPPDTFTYGGITWIRHKAGVKARAAAGGAFIASDEARVVFNGVPSLYMTRYAPADYFETVNTIGVPRYIREAFEERTAKRAKFEVQSNPLHLCTQPKTLRRLTLAA